MAENECEHKQQAITRLMTETLVFNVADDGAFIETDGGGDFDDIEIKVVCRKCGKTLERMSGLDINEWIDGVAFQERVG